MVYARRTHVVNLATSNPRYHFFFTFSVWLLMINIYLLPIGCHRAAMVGKFVQKQERDSYAQKEKQHTKQKTHKTIKQTQKAY
jgi:hypothetical protein